MEWKEHKGYDGYTDYYLDTPVMRLLVKECHQLPKGDLWRFSNGRDYGDSFTRKDCKLVYVADIDGSRHASPEEAKPYSVGFFVSLLRQVASEMEGSSELTRRQVAQKPYDSEEYRDNYGEG